MAAGRITFQERYNYYITQNSENQVGIFKKEAAAPVQAVQAAQPGQEQPAVHDANALIGLQHWHIEFSKAPSATENLQPNIPMAVRNIILAKTAYEASKAGHPVRTATWCESLSTEQPYRFDALFNAAVSGPLSLGWRCVRVAFRTATLPISLLVSAYSQSRFGKELHDRHIVLEDLKSWGREIVDLFTSIYAIFSSAINFLIPNLIPTDKLEKYYVTRIDDEVAYNDAYKRAQNAYKAREHQEFAAFEEAQRQHEQPQAQ